MSNELGHSKEASREELLEWIKHDHVRFNEYRASKPDHRVVLSDKDNRLDLSGKWIGPGPGRHTVDKDSPEFAPLNLSDVGLDYADLRGTVFSRGCWLNGASFVHAKLVNTHFGSSDGTGDYPSLNGTNFSSADLSLANLGSRGVREAVFIDTKGLHGPRKVRGLQNWRQADEAIFHRRWDVFSWNSMRTITSLHLRGASYIAFLFIVVYAGVARWFARAADQLETWAGQYSDDGLPGVSWIAHIPDLPVPAWFGTQLLAIVVLAIATTIYTRACLEVIQHYRRTKWVEELSNLEVNDRDGRLVEYSAADFSHRRWRYLCSVLYWLSALYSVGYLSYRGYRALSYLFELG